jgi:hypothetical protein
MVRRHYLALVLVSIFPSLGASYRTAGGNFQVEAPTPQIAEQVGKWAEYYRKEKALQWLGREMPPWPEPCPLHVHITMSGPGGATSFDFQPGHIWQNMNIEGPLDRLLASVLPHEITHTVFAHYFGCPVPRWADEGSAVLSEDDQERSRHDMMVRQSLNAGRAFTLNRLFTLHNYPNDPRDIGTFYAEGYSVSAFLVSLSDRRTFLTFIGHGMQYGWDSAAQTVYRFQNVNQLEQAWLDYLKKGRRPSEGLLASNTQPATAEAAKRVVVRLTAPPVQPLQEEEAASVVARGQSSEADTVSWTNSPRAGTNRPGYLPDPVARPAPQGTWRPPAARLRSPKVETPGPGNPVGYPN